MAASSQLREFNISLAVSSSASSVETEKSQEEYTEDFHPSLRSTDEEISSKSYEISADLYSDNDVNADECVAKFVGKKLQILKENRVTTTKKSTGDPKALQDYRQLSPFLLKKFDILQQRNASRQQQRSKEHIHTNLYKLNSKSDDTSTNRCYNSKVETNVDEIGSLQSAYERIKFESLRHRCLRLLESEIRSPETCKKCQQMQEQLLKNEFYSSCVRKVKQNTVEEKLSEHMQSTSSALLIAKIIEEGPRPNWTGDEIWDKLLSGGYQHEQSN